MSRWKNSSRSVKFAVVASVMLAASFQIPIPAASAAPLAEHSAQSDISDGLAGMRAHAVAAGDVNGDGWVDVFVGTFADRPVEEYAVRGAAGPAPDRLLLGGPSGFRIDSTFPGALGRTSGAAFADLDGDGDLDLVILRQPRSGARSSAPSVVLRNTGGRFSQAAVLDAARGLRSVAVLDYDADGRLDLLLVEDRFSGGSSVLLRNGGGFRFTDATAAASLPSDIHGLGVVAADLNGDSRTDLFVGGSNRLFVARGAGFREVNGPFEWLTFGDEDDVAGVAAGDVDRDGRIDLVLGHHFNSTLDDGQLVSVRLYLNRGNDVFGNPIYEDTTVAAGLVGMPTKAPHVELVDLDSDGLLDIVTSASSDGGSTPAIFYQRAGTTPTFTAPQGLGATQYWVAGAIFDADRNGTRDVFVAEWEPAISSKLLSGPGRNGNWLDVEIGQTGAAGVGAVVEVFQPGRLGNTSRRIATMPIVASTGYGSGAVPIAQIGVGAWGSVDLRITMPNNGKVITRSRIAANRTLTISASEAGGPGQITSAAPSLPGVELIRYDRPTYAGKPWTQWGQGLVLSDGRFVSAIGDHLGADGNSFIYVYSPTTKRLSLAGDVLSAVPHNPGSWGYGKVHGQMVQTDSRTVVFATYWGNRTGLTYGGTYQGDYLMKFDTTTQRISPLGVPIPGRGIPSLDSHGGLVYGEAVEPVTDTGEFFVYNPSTRKLVTRTSDPSHDGFRGMAVMNDGTAYIATAGPSMLKYSPVTGRLTTHSAQLPAGWLRATTDPDASGTVYGVTRRPERFVSISSNGSVRDLGAAPGYITTLALDGNRVLFMPGAHGSAHDDGAALMSFDTRTGEQHVLAELNPVAEAQLGLTLGGTYSLAIDRARNRLFVGLNAGPSRDDPWGEVVLAVIDLVTLGSHAPSYPPGYCGPTVNPTPTPTESSAAGYWVLDASGKVLAFGADHHGDLTTGEPALANGVSAVGLAKSPSGLGYWIVDSTGTVSAYGDAQHLGDASELDLKAPIVSIAAHPTANGYWLLGEDGGVFTFGAAEFHGSTGALTLNAPVTAIAATSDGAGYWLLATDGGVFTFGTAVFRGSTGALKLNAPVTSMAVRGDGLGYWLIATDGGVFGFDAPFVGSIPGTGLCNAPGAVALAPTNSGAGYYTLLDDGGVFTFGDAMFRGADPKLVPAPVDIDVAG